MKSTSFLILSACMALVLASASANGQARKAATQSVRVQITKMGYEPGSFRLRRGVPARITFLRLTDETCATEVLFPDYGINRRLPLNQAVTVRLTPSRAGTFAFTCGMNMHRGKMIVQ